MKISLKARGSQRVSRPSTDAAGGVFTNSYDTGIMPLVPRWFQGLRWYITNRFYSFVREGYQHNAVTYACIRTLAQATSEAPLKIYEQNKAGRRVENPKHEVQALLDRPNPMMSQFEMLELLVTHLSIVGTTWWWKERNNDGSIRALWPLRPDRMYPKYGAGDVPLDAWSYYISGYYYRDMDPEDIFFVHYPDPLGETAGLVEGIGPLQVMSREVDTDNVSTGFVFALLDNFAMPGVILEVDKKLDAPGAERIKKSWREKYGRMRRGDTAVLDSGTKVKSMSFNPKQLEINVMRGSLEARICAAFGIPAMLIGVKGGLEDATYSNLEQARAYFAETTLSHIWARLANAFTDQILNDKKAGYATDSETCADFDKSKVRALQEVLARETDRYTQGFEKGGVLIDEYRDKALGLDPLPNGKGQAFIIPGTAQVISLTDPEPSDDPNVIPPGPPDQQGLLGKKPPQQALPPHTVDYNPASLAKARTLMLNP